MSQTYNWPSQSITATNPSVSTNNLAIPGSSTLVGGSDGTDLRPISTDTSGHLNVNSTQVGTSSVNLAQIVGAAPSSTNALPAELTYAGVFIDPRQIRDLTAATDIITAVQSGVWTQNLTEVGGAAIALGQALMAASLPVVIASNQSALPVSAASLPLPAGAATSANQTSEITELTSINTNTSHLPAALGQTTMVSSLPVVIASDQSTLPVSAASLPLPAGAATAANQTTEITELTGINTNTSHLPTALGQTTMSASLPVTLASDQTELPASKGRAQANVPARNVYSTTNVTTTAFVQLVASTTSATSLIEVFDSSGQTMALATGAAGLEVIQCYIFPGGQGQIPISIAAGTRVSIEAVSANATTGEIDINFWQ